MKPPPIVRGSALATAWSDATEAWNRDDMAAVIRILEPAAEGAPDEAELHFYLGLARLRSDDGPGAVKDLERADDLHEPPSAIIRWTLVAALERASRFEDACRVLRQVADLESTRADEARRIASERCPPPD
jgi:Flp pilus assembly protein TadD